MRLGATRILRHRRRSFVAARMARACGRVAKTAPKKARKASEEEAIVESVANSVEPVVQEKVEAEEKPTEHEQSTEEEQTSTDQKSSESPLPEIMTPLPDVNMEQLLEEFMQEDKSEEPLSPLLTASDELPEVAESATNTTTTEPERHQSWPIDQPAESLTFSILNNPKTVTVTHNARASQQAAEPEVSAEDAQAAFEDFFDYESMCEDDSSDEAVSPESSPKKASSPRLVPLCGFRDRFTETFESSQLSNASKMTSRRLLAAWQTVYPDITHQSWQTYTQAVLLAAASMNQTSLTSGRARETMV